MAQFARVGLQTEADSEMAPPISISRLFTENCAYMLGVVKSRQVTSRHRLTKQADGLLIGGKDANRPAGVLAVQPPASHLPIPAALDDRRLRCDVVNLQWRETGAGWKPCRARAR